MGEDSRSYSQAGGPSSWTSFRPAWNRSEFVKRCDGAGGGAISSLERVPAVPGRSALRA